MVSEFQCFGVVVLSGFILYFVLIFRGILPRSRLKCSFCYPIGFIYLDWLKSLNSSWSPIYKNANNIRLTSFVHGFQYMRITNEVLSDEDLSM